MKRSIFLLLLVFSCLIQSFAGVPNVINYSGKIVDKNGNLLPDGKYNIRFSFWNAATSGTEVWSEQHNSGIPDNSVQVTAGAYTTILGSISSPLPDFNQNLYLQTEITINSVVENFGRRVLNSVPYARRAEIANQVADNSVNSSKITDASILGGDIAVYTISGGVNGNIAPSTITGGNLVPATVDQTRAPFAPLVAVGGYWVWSSLGKYPIIAAGTGATDGGGNATINLSPYAFTSTPVVVCTATPGANTRIIMIASQSASQCGVYSRDDVNGVAAGVPFNWVAIGY